MTYLLALILGSIYGFTFGIIPVAGAATGLITIYGFMDYFRADPYLLVIFTTAVVVASTIGDSFASVVMNIPGANGSAATMVDGFPMARRGEGARALSAALVTSTVNGAIWGGLVFCFLPYYASIIMGFGIPEMWAFTMLSMACITFLNGKYWVRSLCGLGLGVFLGLVGSDPVSNAERFTGGWFYLAAGIQIMPVLAGFLAVPELLEAMYSKVETIKINKQEIRRQMWQGVRDSWKMKWDGLRGGAIGGVIGLLPGIGGNIADWLAYGQTVAMNKKEEFGKGNVRGVIGCEGANNAQKATAYVPTVLFGVPAAPFEAVVMALFMYVGLEMGSPALLADMTFFNVLTSSYMGSLLIAFVLSVIFIRYAVNIMRIPFKYYFWPLLVVIIWSCVQYTGGWEDYAVFAACAIAGLVCKYFKISRASIVIGFVLADRVEMLSRQFFSLYSFTDIFGRPISVTLLTVAVAAAIYGIFFNKSRIDYQ